MNKFYISFCLLFFSYTYCSAQDVKKIDTTIHYSVENQVIVTSNNSVPFWMRSNTYGSIPLEGISEVVIGKIHRNYSKENKLFDWGAGLEGRVNIGNGSEFLLIEGFLKAKLGVFQLKAGRSKDVMGLVDSTLSSGAFSISGNSLGIPKIELSIPEYYTLPILNKFLSVKGSISHGWFGSTPLKKEKIVITDRVSSYYHQLSFYGRIGKPESKLKLYGGVNHQVMWGNSRKIFGQDFELSALQEFFKVFTGTEYGNKGLGTSKIGNHIGSIDQEVELDLNSVNVKFYHQFFYDIGSLYYLNNLKDGLFGIVIENKKQNKQTFSLNKLLIELLQSKSQGGERTANWTPSGSEDYYNNYIYYDGWTYKGENLGNPLLTNVNYIRSNLPNRYEKYFPNNRVVALHLGTLFNYKEFAFKVLTSYSTNYGNYSTSPYSKGRGNDYVENPPPYFPKVSQFSGSLETSWYSGKGYHLGILIAGDSGNLLHNSTGGLIKITKNW